MNEQNLQRLLTEIVQAINLHEQKLNTLAAVSAQLIERQAKAKLHFGLN